MFNLKVTKAPSKKASDVLNAFTKAISDLEEVATQHDEYAKQQDELAKQAQKEAADAQEEAARARSHVEALNKALGR